VNHQSDQQCKFLGVHTALCGVVQHWQLACGPKTKGSVTVLGVLEGCKNVTVCNAKRQFARSGQFSEFHIFDPPKCHPLHSGARGACPPSPPSRRHWLQQCYCVKNSKFKGIHSQVTIPIAICLHNVNGKSQRVVQRHYSGEVENVYTTLHQIHSGKYVPNFS